MSRGVRLHLPAILVTGALGGLMAASGRLSQQDKIPLPSWNDGAAKKAILEFVRATTDKASPKFVPPEQRIATFDQDGTLWVEHPMYTQVIYCLERVPAVVKAEAGTEGHGAVQDRAVRQPRGDRQAPMKDLEEILAATLSGMTVEEFQAEVKKWLATAKHPRWKRPYTELTYQPMLEVLKYFRANGYKTYIVTGGGQDFVRVYAEQVYGIPPEQVVGTAGGTKYGYDKDGKPMLTKEPKLLLNDNNAGKPEGIHLMIGRRPYAAFGNSTGDQQMLEYTDGRRRRPAGMLVLHDDAKREYAYGPAQGLPDTKVGTFTQALYDEAKKQRLDRHQHEERLEADVSVREVTEAILAERIASPVTSIRRRNDMLRNSKVLAVLVRWRSGCCWVMRPHRDRLDRASTARPTRLPAASEHVREAKPCCASVAIERPMLAAAALRCWRSDPRRP